VNEPHDPNVTADIPSTPPDSLEAGLAAGFAKRADGPQSVLTGLHSKLGHLRPVLLREAEGESEHVVKPKSDAMPSPKETGDRYHLSGEIARGGMGAVLRGRDNDLGRDLAFKILLEKYANRPEVARRFVEEAQIAGQLQHPGVVPVYDIGRFGERPFFTMKLVKGRTLAAILNERTDPAADRPRLLGTALRVAETLAYAHAKGVIHRDLKPANIMVGAFGEVQVMDWGLAKVLTEGGVADEEQASRMHQVPEDVTTIRTARSVGSIGSVGSETEAGSLLGTPAYMPPEQALGEIANVDRRADVFGLGAILCEILTGKPPYVGRSNEEVRRKAANGDLADARTRLDECVADAELIALTRSCLTAEPIDRPKDASEVAAALETYITGVENRARQAELERAAAEARAIEEVNTRREAEAKAVAERKRRKMQTALGSLVMLVVLAGGAAATWQWLRAEREEKNTQDALARVTDEKEKTATALANLTEEQTRTFAALNAMTDEGIERLFQSQVEVSDEQKAFVKKVIALYDQATQANLHTPQGRAQRADGYRRVAKLGTHTADYANAIENSKAALGLYSSLSEAEPENREFLRQMAVCRTYLGWLYSNTNRYVEAESELRLAVEMLNRLIALDEGNLTYRSDLGYALGNMSWTQNRLNRNAQALEYIRSAVRVYQTMRDRGADSREFHIGLVSTTRRLSWELRDDPVESEKVAREAVSVADNLRKRFPQDLRAQDEQMRAHVVLGEALVRLKNDADAEAEFRFVRDGRLEISRRYPLIREYRERLAEVHADLARTLLRLNRRSESLVEDVAASNIYRALIKEVPDNRQYRIQCINCMSRLWNINLVSQSPNAATNAENYLRSAMELIDESLKLANDDRVLLEHSVKAREALGQALIGQRKYTDAIPEFRAALTQLEAMIKESSESRGLLSLRAQAQFNLAIALYGTDQNADAQTAYRSSLAGWEALSQRDMKDYVARNMMARCHSEFARIHFKNENYSEAIASYRIERDIRTKLVADSPTPFYREAHATVIANIGGLLKILDRHADAESEFRAAIDLFRALIAEFPNNRNYQRHMADNLMRLSHAVLSQRRFAEVEKLAVEADRIYAEHYKADSANRTLRTAYALNTSYLAGARAHNGDHPSAGQLLAKMVTLDPNSVLAYGGAACVLGWCVRAAERDDKLTDQKRKDLVNEYTDRALGYLRRGVELLPGATVGERREFEKSRTDKDLDPFRTHPEFMKILADFEKLPQRGPQPREVKP